MVEHNRSIIQGAAQKRAIVRTFFSVTAGIGDTLPPAQAWRSPLR